jgi:hypothetical protein
VSSGQRRGGGRIVFVPIPVELALSYDGTRWRLLPAPPAWWLEERQDLGATAYDTDYPSATEAALRT